MFITQFLHEAAATKPNDMALFCNERITSFDEFKHNVSKIAGGLQQLGISPQHTVAVLALNSDKFAQTVFGTWWLGASINPVNIRWSPAEIIYSLNDCGIEILFIDETFFAILPLIQSQCPKIKHYIHMGETGRDTTPEGFFYFDDWVAKSPVIKDAKATGNQLAAIMYTGGTTGKPKGVMLSFDNLVSNAQAALKMAEYKNTGTVLLVAPLFHVGGLGLLVQATLRQMDVVILKAFIPVEVFKAMQRFKVTQAFFVPTMVQFLLDDPHFNDYDLTSLEYLIYAAAAMDISLLRRAMQAFPKAAFVQVYGMTELSPIVTVLKGTDHLTEAKLRSVGRPTAQVKVKIIDTKGNLLGANQVGEIVVQGSNVMQGYLNKPEETQHALREGWMHTGDGGYLDEDGYLYIADRIKDMIISGGENIYSTEVESAILSYPGIQMCAVIGLPDQKWGETVHAVIVPHPDTEINTNALTQHCRERIAGYKIPRSYDFKPALPLSAAGKILKNELRAMYQQEQVS